ncbi:hypothetical protein [Dongia sp.]|uniref:hypothetical protein n=1 Tax=Dongia sp. TaxID=1977262 RepID=UPI0035ADD05B
MWFTLDERRPLALSAGLWTNFTHVCNAREGTVSADVYGFLTINPNTEVFAVNRKAMPVILRTKEEIEIWMTTPIEDALKLQRPLPDGSPKIVARGSELDGVPE